MGDNMSDDLKSGALVYHRLPRPGKLEIQATKPLGNQRDLALAYSPGVAAACMAIYEDPQEAANLTIRQNLVAVLTNGTAVLGLGNIGPLASKPVMEGKAVLFKKFADIDVFDIEVDQTDVSKLVDVVCSLEPTFGGINLEDIKAPECFEVEEQCRARMNIPVFHDDQHGTAIIVAAGVLNALELAGKQLPDVRIVTSGAGAAALACLNLLVSLGARVENITVTDIKGVVYKGRTELMDRWKDVYAQETEARTLAEVIPGADVFIGLSAGGVLKPEYLEKMAEKPLIMALANPYPEIMPDLAQEKRPDAMICTGRSDFPNQVNNVLCFPYIFRGALDVGATSINEEMKQAAVKAIAALARETPSDVVARAYGGEARPFGRHSLIPSPFDPRLILRIAPAVAKAAMDSGVAGRPLENIQAYADSLDRFVHRSGFIMKPIFSKAKEAPKRVIYAEGEDERVLRAAQAIVEDQVARPILVGRPRVIETRIKRFGLSIKQGTDFDLIDPEDDPRYRDYVATYLEAAGPARHYSGRRPHPGADEFHGDRRGRRAPGRGGCVDLRPGGPVRDTSAGDPRRDRSRAGRARLCRHEPRHHEEGRVLPGRYPCPSGSDRRGDRRCRGGLRRACLAVRHDAEDRSSEPFGFRPVRFPLGHQDAHRAGPDPGSQARTSGGWRDAGR